MRLVFEKLSKESAVLPVIAAFVFVSIGCDSADRNRVNDALSQAVFDDLDKALGIEESDLLPEEADPDLSPSGVADRNVATEVLQSIYHKYGSHPQFLQALWTYLDTQDRCYWIAAFLDDPAFAGIGDKRLSLSVLNKGLQLTSDPSETIKFHFVIGMKLYRMGDIEIAFVHLVQGYELSLEYPGNTPAVWESKTEYEEIMGHILERTTKRRTHLTDSGRS